MAERGRLFASLPAGGRMVAVFTAPERVEALTDEAKLQAFMESSRWSAEDVTSASEQVSQMIFDRLWSLHYRKTW